MLPDDESFNSPADRELAGALAALSPARANLDPVAAAFEAGRRVGQQRVGATLWRWRATAAVLVVGLATVALTRGGGSPTNPPMANHKPSERLMPADVATAAAEPANADLTQSPDSIWQLRTVVLAGGVDALKSHQTTAPLQAGTPAITVRSIEVP